MNIDCIVFMQEFAIWKSDTGMKSNAFFVIGFTRLILFAENPWLRKLNTWYKNIDISDSW